MAAANRMADSMAQREGALTSPLAHQRLWQERQRGDAAEVRESKDGKSAGSQTLGHHGAHEEDEEQRDRGRADSQQSCRQGQARDDDKDDDDDDDDDNDQRGGQAKGRPGRSQRDDRTHEGDGGQWHDPELRGPDTLHENDEDGEDDASAAAARQAKRKHSTVTITTGGTAKEDGNGGSGRSSTRPLTRRAHPAARQLVRSYSLRES